MTKRVGKKEMIEYVKNSYLDGMQKNSLIWPRLLNGERGLTEHIRAAIIRLIRASKGGK